MGRSLHGYRITGLGLGRRKVAEELDAPDPARVQDWVALARAERSEGDQSPVVRHVDLTLDPGESPVEMLEPPPGRSAVSASATMRVSGSATPHDAPTEEARSIRTAIIRARPRRMAIDGPAGGTGIRMRMKTDPPRTPGALRRYQALHQLHSFSARHSRYLHDEILAQSGNDGQVLFEHDPQPLQTPRTRVASPKLDEASQALEYTGASDAYRTLLWDRLCDVAATKDAKRLDIACEAAVVLARLEAVGSMTRSGVAIATGVPELAHADLLLSAAQATLTSDWVKVLAVGRNAVVDLAANPRQAAALLQEYGHIAARGNHRQLLLAALDLSRLASVPPGTRVPAGVLSQLLAGWRSDCYRDDARESVRQSVHDLQ